MTILEVLEEITSTPLYYKGKMKQPTASNTVRGIRAGIVKPATIKKFFNRFGYVGHYNEWQKA